MEGRAVRSGDYVLHKGSHFAALVVCGNFNRARVDFFAADTDACAAIVDGHDVFVLDTLAVSALAAGPGATVYKVVDDRASPLPAPAVVRAGAGLLKQKLPAAISLNAFRKAIKDLRAVTVIRLFNIYTQMCYHYFTDSVLPN